MPAYCSFYVIGKKKIVYVYVLEAKGMDIQRVFIWSLFNFNFFVNSKKQSYSIFSSSPLNIWEIIFIFYLKNVEKWNLF